MASKTLPVLPAAIVPLLAGLLLMPGCSDDEGPGHIVIPFEFALNKTCDELGVTKVRATLSEDIEDDAPCENGEVRLDDVPAGGYNLVLEGLDGNGVTIVDNGATDEKVEIIGDGATTEAEEVMLTSTPAQVLIRWDFEFVTCDSVDWADLEVEAYDFESTQLLHTATFACDEPAEEGMQGYHLVEDEGRDLIGDNLNYIGIQPVDDSGADVGPVIEFQFVEVGAGYPVEISLSCNEDGCDCQQKNGDDECVLD